MLCAASWLKSSAGILSDCRSDTVGDRVQCQPGTPHTRVATVKCCKLPLLAGLRCLRPGGTRRSTCPTRGRLPTEVAGHPHLRHVHAVRATARLQSGRGRHRVGRMVQALRRGGLTNRFPVRFAGQASTGTDFSPHPGEVECDVRRAPCALSACAILVGLGGSPRAQGVPRRLPRRRPLS